MARTRLLLRTLSNPLFVASLVGVTLSLTGISLPTAIHAPLELIAGMAIPAMLLAYGVSLRLGPPPVSGGSRSEILTIAALKLVAQPVAAYLVARFAFGLDGTSLYAVTVLAALPTAQNVFVLATRYDRAVVVSRDAIFVYHGRIGPGDRGHLRTTGLTGWILTAVRRDLAFEWRTARPVTKSSECRRRLQ